MKLYLAGPEVFLPDAAGIGRRKQDICARHGHIGLYPLDNDFDAGPATDRLARLIFVGNLALIRQADAVVANLSPFRGSGADPGTVFEVGFAHALGKPVHGYSSDPRSLLERVADGAALRPGSDGRRFAADGLAVEDFGLFDNLMIAEALASLRCAANQSSGPDAWTDLTLFETVVAGLGAGLFDG